MLASTVSLALLGMIVLAAAATGPAQAGEVFVQQSPGAVQDARITIKSEDHSFLQNEQEGAGTAKSLGNHFAKSSSSGGNVVNSLAFGNNNLIQQTQYGTDNRSDVGIFAGNQNRVGVLQAGHGLRSTVGLINTNGVGILVLQPNGSPAVNLWAIGLPNGGLLVAR
jgi:hypothetical protein